MSDSTEDRRHRGRRGSLLDHARDAQPDVNEPVRETAHAAARPDHASSGPAPSLLATPVRSTRISTARVPRPDDSAPPAPPRSLLASASDEPAPAAARSSHVPAGQASSGRERFGDRIARLIGTIGPDEKPAAHQSTSDDYDDENEPVDDAEPSRSEAPRYAAGQAQPPFPHDRPRDQSQLHDDHYHWHAASSGGQYEDGTRPLLDASILISAVWRFRRMIGAAAFAGAVLGVLMALSTPHKYYAESRLFVDPREIRVTEDDIRNQQLSTEAMLAITDSQLQILSSTSVLEKVIVDLGLDRDPEFNGSLSPGGISGGLSLIKEIFTGKDPASEGEQKALNNLRKALSVARDAKTFVIIVGVDTRDPDKSALIANQIVETYLDSEGQAQSSLLERTSESIDTRINSLRSDLDAAEREVERFKAENGLVGVGGQYIDDKVILALSDQLANARAMKVGIRVKADNLAKVNIKDVLSGAFPEELLSTNLSELRKQYTQTKSSAESLATRLGPRHPQYIAALQSLETITNEISAELRRIVASSQTELQRAVATEQELASQMAVAKSRAIDQSVELVTLRELERKAAATRGIYESFLTRSRETSERSNLSTRNVRVISPAEAPLQPMGPSRKILVIACMLAGLFAGLGLALLIGAIESIRAYNGGLPQARFPGNPSGGNPEPTPPGPRTPPGGPGKRFWPRRNNNKSAGETSTGEASAEPFYGARAQASEKASDRAGDDNQARREPVRVEPAVAKSARVPHRPAAQSAAAAPTILASAEPDPVWPQSAADVLAEADANAAQERMMQRQPQATAAYAQPQARQAVPETGRNAQAFMSGHGQPQYPQSQYPQPQYPMPAFAPELDPRMAQPLWATYPAQPQFRPPLPPVYPVPQAYPPLSAHPFHSGYAGDPYAALQPSYNPGYLPAHVAVAPVYAVPLPQMMPVQQHPFPYQPHAAAPVQPPYPVQPQHPAQGQVAPAPVQAAQQAAPEAPAVPRAEPTQPAEPVRPARNTEAVDRIRREMDDLRSRIDGQGSARRRA